MNYYILLMRQAGEGCDYTIGCGYKWQPFLAESTEGAIEKAKQIVRDHGWGDDRATEAVLVPASDLVDLAPLLDAEDAQAKVAEAAIAAERKELAERETFERLKKQFDQ